jgi:hypothetical protein
VLPHQENRTSFRRITALCFNEKRNYYTPTPVLNCVSIFDWAWGYSVGGITSLTNDSDLKVKAITNKIVKHIKLVIIKTCRNWLIKSKL